MDSMIHLLFSILRTISHDASSSTDVYAFKFWMVQYDTFYGDQIQQDILECLMMLIKVINKGSVP